MRSKTYLAVVGALMVLGTFAPVSSAAEDITFRICDTDGHCDRQCTLTPGLKPSFHCGPA